MCGQTLLFIVIVNESELTGNGSLASWIMKPSITCVNIFGFLDFPDDLDTTTGFSSHFFS